MSRREKTPCSRNCGREATRRGFCGACYMRHMTRQKAYGRWESKLIDAQPARDHVTALRAAGLGLQSISQQSGVSRFAIQTLMNGRARNGRREPPSRQITRHNAEHLLAIPIPEARHHNGYLPSTGSRRRLQALIAIGHTRDALAHQSGVNRETIERLAAGAQEWVTPTNADKIRALFTELQMTPGPSTRSRRHAAHHGWPLPLDWDEDRIDDPSHWIKRSPQPSPKNKRRSGTATTNSKGAA